MKRSKPPKISETEWEIMNVVWQQGDVTAAGVVESLRARDPSWHPKTAGTLLNRLVRKRALGFRKEGRGYVYFPLVARAACVGAESDSFLNRLFGGSFKPLLVHMVEYKKLSSREIKELRAILDANETKEME
jgi:BlaI family penicillinase repressor